MAKKLSTIFKNAVGKYAEEHAKKAEHQRINTDVEINKVTYSDFPYLINPQRSTLLVIFGIVVAWFEGLFFFGIPSSVHILNMFFLKVKKNTFAHTEHQVTTRQDKRYKQGYRIEGSRNVTTHLHDKFNPYIPLDASDIAFNQKWKWRVLICYLLHPFNWATILIYLVIAKFLAKRKNAQTPVAETPFLTFDFEEIFKKSVEIFVSKEADGSVKFIDYQGKLSNPELQYLDMVKFRIFSDKQILDKNTQTHLSLYYEIKDYGNVNVEAAETEISIKSIFNAVFNLFSNNQEFENSAFQLEANKFKIIVNGVCNFFNIHNDFWSSKDAVAVSEKQWRGRSFFINETDLVSISILDEKYLEVSIMNIEKFIE